MGVPDQTHEARLGVGTAPVDFERYQRQMVLPEVGVEGQRKLAASRVLVVGVGALGSIAATYVAAAGVGHVGLVDGDAVALSNLHRQILYATEDVGVMKTTVLAQRLKALNPDVQVVSYPEFLSADNAMDIIGSYDLVVNGSDNFPTRYLINDASTLLNRPWVDAALLRFDGQLAVFRPGHGCYRCLFPVPPPAGTVPDCAEAGILGAVAGVLASVQAVEVIKEILGLDSSRESSLRLYDALRGSWSAVKFNRDQDCLVCGDRPSITHLVDYENFCGTPLPKVSVGGPMTEDDTVTIDTGSALALVEQGIRVLDVRTAEEFAAGHVPGAKNYPMDVLDSAIAAIAPDQGVLVVCEAGQRSQKATEYLIRRGLKAVSLKGGILAWRAAGQPWSKD